jgi:hypothetical protein
MSPGWNKLEEAAAMVNVGFQMHPPVSTPKGPGSGGISCLVST